MPHPTANIIKTMDMLLTSTNALCVYGVSKPCHSSSKRLPLTVRNEPLYLAASNNVWSDDSDGEIKSAALEWMSEQRRKLAEEDGKGEFMESLNNEIVVTANKKKIVVVGGALDEMLRD